MSSSPLSLTVEMLAIIIASLGNFLKVNVSVFLGNISQENLKEYDAIATLLLERLETPSAGTSFSEKELRVIYLALLVFYKTAEGAPQLFTSEEGKAQFNAIQNTLNWAADIMEEIIKKYEK